MGRHHKVHGLKRVGDQKKKMVKAPSAGYFVSAKNMVCDAACFINFLLHYWMYFSNACWWMHHIESIEIEMSYWSSSCKPLVFYFVICSSFYLCMFESSGDMHLAGSLGVLPLWYLYWQPKWSTLTLKANLFMPFRGRLFEVTLQLIVQHS